MQCSILVLLFALLSDVNADRSVQECVQGRLDKITERLFYGYKLGIEYTMRKDNLIKLEDLFAVVRGEVLDDLKLAYAGIGKSTTTEELDANKRIADKIVDSKIAAWTSKFKSALKDLVEESSPLPEELIDQVMILKNKYIEFIEELSSCCFEEAGCTTEQEENDVLRGEL